MYKIIFLLLVPFVSCYAQKNDLNKLFAAFENEKSTLNIPVYVMDYKENLKSVKSIDSLLIIQEFYTRYLSLMGKINRESLLLNDKINYDHLKYIIKLELERFDLEIEFAKSSRNIPEVGLAGIENAVKWYQYYIHMQTNTSLTPEELMQFGKAEVKRVQDSIEMLKTNMGYANKDAAFYEYLKGDKFYISDIAEIKKVYKQNETIVRNNLSRLFQDTQVPVLDIGIWDNATPMMPPGIYRSGQNKFEYNFSTKKHNIRAMDWVLNHEGIPGHHYQFSIMSKDKASNPSVFSNVYYPGTSEGWACYTEYLGKELGQYQTMEEYLGKWEWDLIRSARVVLEVGIHYYGWSAEMGLSYWKENIKGQDDIAIREITRVTNWPAQALAYKVGAMKIEKLKQKLQVNSNTIKKFHAVFLRFTRVPMEVIEMDIEEAFTMFK